MSTPTTLFGGLSVAGGLTERSEAGPKIDERSGAAGREEMRERPGREKAGQAQMSERVKPWPKGSVGSIM